jgi:hypothetical protein
MFLTVLPYQPRLPLFCLQLRLSLVRLHILHRVQKQFRITRLENLSVNLLIPYLLYSNALGFFLVQG